MWLSRLPFLSSWTTQIRDNLCVPLLTSSLWHHTPSKYWSHPAGMFEVSCGWIRLPCMSEQLLDQHSCCSCGVPLCYPTLQEDTFVKQYCYAILRAAMMLAMFVSWLQAWHHQYYLNFSSTTAYLVSASGPFQSAVVRMILKDHLLLSLTSASHCRDLFRNGCSRQRSLL